MNDDNLTRRKQKTRPKAANVEAGRETGSIAAPPVRPSSEESFRCPCLVDRDELLSLIRHRLPQPIRQEEAFGGVTTIIAGSPGELVIQLSDDTVSIGIYAIRWDGPHTPVEHPKWLGTLNWKNLPEPDLSVILHSFTFIGSKLRTSQYRTCERCGEVTPPEFMHNSNTCQGCAERYLGVVH